MQFLIVEFFLKTTFPIFNNNHDIFFLKGSAVPAVHYAKMFLKKNNLENLRPVFLSMKHVFFSKLILIDFVHTMKKLDNIRYLDYAMAIQQFKNS